MNFNDLTLLSVGRLSQTNRFIAAAEGADPTLCHAVDKVDGVDGDTVLPKKHAWLYPAGAINEGDFVAIDFSTTTNGLLRHVVASSAATDCIIGVAEEAASAASTINPIKICIAGEPNTQACNVATSVAAGNLLIGSSTSGRAAAGTAKDGEQVVGRALTAESGNDARVVIRDRGFFG